MIIKRFGKQIWWGRGFVVVGDIDILMGNLIYNKEVNYKDEYFSGIN